MKTLSECYTGAASFADMASASAEYGALFQAQRDRAVVPADLLARSEALGGAWHLLVISEDWCIDSHRAVRERVPAEWKPLDKPERNKEIRRWYAVDKGHAILEEMVSLLERAAA